MTHSPQQTNHRLSKTAVIHDSNSTGYDNSQGVQLEIGLGIGLDSDFYVIETAASGQCVSQNITKGDMLCGINGRSLQEFGCHDVASFAAACKEKTKPCVLNFNSINSRNVAKNVTIQDTRAHNSKLDDDEHQGVRLELGLGIRLCESSNTKFCVVEEAIQGQCVGQGVKLCDYLVGVNGKSLSDCGVYDTDSFMACLAQTGKPCTLNFNHLPKPKPHAPAPRAPAPVYRPAPPPPQPPKKGFPWCLFILVVLLIGAIAAAVYCETDGRHTDAFDGRFCEKQTITITV
jgi:hypothetical protein